MVTVTMSGHKRVLALKIDPEALYAGVDGVEDLIVAALNHAVDKVDELASSPVRGTFIAPGVSGRKAYPFRDPRRPNHSVQGATSGSIVSVMPDLIHIHRPALTPLSQSRTVDVGSSPA